MGSRLKIFNDLTAGQIQVQKLITHLNMDGEGDMDTKRTTIRVWPSPSLFISQGLMNDKIGGHVVLMPWLSFLGVFTSMQYHFIPLMKLTHTRG